MESEAVRCPAVMPPATTQAPLEYAPGSPRPRWLSRQAVTLGILGLAAVLAGWIVVPRVLQRADLLRAQTVLLENRALPAGTVAETTWVGSLPAVMMIDRDAPELRKVTGWTVSRPTSLPAYAGGRNAGRGKRLVLVFAEPTIHGDRSPPELTLTCYVVEPGTWWQSPRLLHQSVTGPLKLPVPLESGWRLAVLAGKPDPADQSRFTFWLEAGYEQTDAERRLEVTGFLMADNTVRFDWPATAQPVPDPAGRPE